MRAAWLVIGMALTLAGTAKAQQRVEDAPDPYVHKATGFAFPAQLGPFTRTSVVEYDADARDASAGYEMIVDGKSVALVTVYVYPPHASGPTPQARCDADFAGAQAAITDRFAGAEMADKGSLPKADPRIGPRARSVSYRITADLFAPRQKVLSDVVLYCQPRGDWHVKYRISVPADAPREAEMTAFMRALAWPEGLKR